MKTHNLFRYFLLCMTLLLCGTATLYAQAGKQQLVTLKLNNVELKTIISQIEAQTDYLFVYDDDLINSQKKISISVTDARIEDVLPKVLSKSLTFSLSENNIILKETREDSKPVNTTYPLKGVVTNPEGEAVIGATIMIKGKNKGTITGYDGDFELEVSTDDRLIVSFIGYSSQEVRVAGKKSLQISLFDDIELLDEVVVVGYGTLKKGEVTSSIASIKREDFIQGEVSSPLELVKGKVAGLMVSTVNGSDPTKDDGGVQIMLRGVSNLTGNQEPLVVIDGIAGASLSMIAAEDVESIDVLKDGSAAAIYGTRGNNGVIIVTTKKGVGANQGRAVVEYHGYTSYETISNSIDVLSASEFLDLPTTTGGKALTSVTDLGADTDWFQEIYQTPINQNHNLSVRSGDAASNIALTLNYLTQDGILQNSGKEQLKARLAANQSLWDGRLRFFGSAVGTMVTSNYVSPSIYYNSLLVNPTAPIKDETTGSYTYFQDATNPVQEMDEKTTDTKWNRFSLNGKVTVEPIDNLNLSAIGSLERFNSIEGVFATYDYINGDIYNGEVWRNTKYQDLKTLEFVGDYSITVKDSHRIALMAGYSYQEQNYEGFNLYNYDYPTESLSYNSPGLGLALMEGDASIGGYRSSSKLISGFARANYSYLDKYLLSLSVRREGSSKFGDNNKWGTFPAISAGWVISDEEFLKPVKWVDNLKLRVGYGVTGAEPSSSYLSVNQYSYSSPVYSDGEWIWSIAPSMNNNEDLRWETKKEFNVGLDYSVLKGRISGSIDWYNRRTDDLIYTYQVPVPPNLVSDIYANVGSISNAGIEVLVSAIPVRTKDFTWNVSANFSYNQNVVNSLSNEMYQRDYLETGSTGSPIQKTTHIVREGEAIGNFYGWASSSISEDGSQWLDANGDPITMENDDREIIGNGIPSIYTGFNTSIQYKGLDASISLRGAGDFDILNQYRMLHETFMEGGNQNYPTTILNQPYGVDTYIYTAPSYVSYFVEEGDYLKIDNITVGYSFKFNEYVQKLRLYASGSNLYTFTEYTGVDPEVNLLGLSPGIDYIGSLYPSTRTFSLGVQVTLF